MPDQQTVRLAAQDDAVAETIQSCWGLHDAATITLGRAARPLLDDFASEIEHLEKVVGSGAPVDELSESLAVVLRQAITLTTKASP